MPALSEVYTQSIASALDEGATVVLPSELAAEFWRREVVRSGMRAAIREDLIVSWDRFKEQAFDLRTDRMPANRTARAVFVDRLIAENAAAPFLRRLIPPPSAAQADGFRAHIARSLPALAQAHLLDALLEGNELAAESGGQVAGLGALLADLSEIERRYTAFLDEHGLFEPAWLERAPAYRGGDHFLVMPGLAEDFPEFEAALAGVPRVGIPRGDEKPLPELQQYPDSRAELESTLGAIAALLDAGTPPESIVLTVCDLESVRPRLEQAARLANVPIDVRQGLPLGGSAPGRFFAAMADVVSSGFGLDALKRLLLNRAVPWRDPAVNARLIVAGAGAGCLGGRDRPDPRWRRVPSGPERALIDLLVGQLPGFTRARSATDLLAAWRRMRERLIDPDGWAPQDEMLLQRCIVVLGELAEFEQRHGMRIGSPYRFWIDSLREHLYVPRSDDRGVVVLPYRVGAAVCPEHHFVIGASNVASRVRIARYPFLTEAEREKLGDPVADRDLSEAFARAYAVSGATVRVSCSRTTWDGPALPPGEYVAAGRLGEPVPHASPFAPWRREELFLDEPAKRVYRLQRDGAAAYTRGAPPAGRVDLTAHALTHDDLIDGVLAAQRHRRKPDLLSLSASDVQSFRACPFSYLFTRGLGVCELDYRVDPDCAANIGSLYHDTLETFYGELHAAGERFDPSRREEYLRRLLEIFGERSRSAPGMVPAFVYAALEPLAARVFAELLGNDEKLIAGHRIEQIEAWEDRPDLATGVYLVGRIDRVTRGPDGALTLVDYKKRATATQKEQHGGSKDATGVTELPREERAAERERIRSVQIPFYIRLLEATGEHVGTAAYYTLEEGKLVNVASDDPTTGKTVMSRERMNEVLVLLDDIVREITERIVAGDYACGEGCDGCAFRGLCRTKFVVR
ncbi:MAG: PD-(D/E)XK nuclease family protein [Spirochaetota bacterium]